jgi:endoglucanase
VALLLGLGVLAVAGSAAAAPLAIRGTIAPAVWQAFAGRFVDPSGRVVDDANGGISHSEGQGYGLLLAFAADDRATFERIWSFTQTELLLRDDGLAVWSWRPTTPHVPDVNNASDGDILIAYALALAGKAWDVERYLDAATRLAGAIGRRAIAAESGRPILLPGVDGFARGERPDGPVVNLSYWVFEALPVLAPLAPDADWAALSRGGLELIGRSRFGGAGLPTDWVSLAHGTPAPAAGFEPDFGYNAIRIPLYLLRGNVGDAALLAPFARAWQGGAARGIALVDVKADRTVATLTEPGYRMLAATLACATGGTPLPADLRLFTPTHYFPSTLYLLSLSYLVERHPECL